MQKLKGVLGGLLTCFLASCIENVRHETEWARMSTTPDSGVTQESVLSNDDNADRVKEWDGVSQGKKHAAQFDTSDSDSHVDTDPILLSNSDSSTPKDSSDEISSQSAVVDQRVKMTHKSLSNSVIRAVDKSSVDAGSSQPELVPAKSTEASPIEQTLLSMAEIAFRKGQLTSPGHDNAYDKFKSVLLINPENASARAGLQAILIRYVEMARNEMNQYHVGQAGTLITRALEFFPGNELLLELQRKNRDAVKKEIEALLSEDPSMDASNFVLPSSALGKKDVRVSGYLGKIAVRLRETNESVLIYARSDSEGRWIYKQLKQAVPGYRVRGDIKISKTPKLALLPPLQ